MDKSSVRFRLQPSNYNHSMVVLVLSAPNNTNQRKKLRKQVALINKGKFINDAKAETRRTPSMGIFLAK